MDLGRVLRQGVAVVERRRAYLVPAALGLALWIGFPTTTANQDIAAMISGEDAGGIRWNGYVRRSVADSVDAVELSFRDGITTGATASSRVPGMGEMALRARSKGKARTPDEARIVRATKKGRLMQVAPVAPPKAFTAGSIFQRTSSLLHPALDTGGKLAFAKPAIKGQEVQIASAFHLRRSPASRMVVPSYLADLITNDKPDVLAAAYAPAKPDYAKSSPFDSLLKEDPNGGRFIPPLGKGDHVWMQQPLPAEVFSAKEQQCLANAVYFEARGESARGQAAVAQVVLNRVRNPAYPNTICGVVYQNQHMRNACQFSFACDGIKDRILSPGHYRKAKDIALAVTAGKIFIPEVGSSTHYYAQYVSPGWARAMNRMTKIGLHIFYRTKRGGWS